MTMPAMVAAMPCGPTPAGLEARFCVPARYVAGVQEPIAAALSGMGVFQPMLTALVGLVPNCAVSVLLAQLPVSTSLPLPPTNGVFWSSA